jgi:hypothetical protein
MTAVAGMTRMAQLTHAQYDLLERAVTRGERIIVLRRGTEYIVIPLSLAMSGGREMIEARNPTTGDSMTLYLDEVDSIEAVAR